MNPQSPLEQPDGNNPPGTGQPIGKVPRGGRGGVGGLPGKGPGVAGLPGKDPSVGSVLGKGLGGVEGMPGKALVGARRTGAGSLLAGSPQSAVPAPW